MIDSIIRFNNSQNAIEASDFRSTDGIQKRLREEFGKIAHADYEGGRRGNISDAIKRRPNLLPSYTVGQALTAFHGDPVLAYNEKSRIWTDNNAYTRIFNDETGAKHIMMCFSLLRAIEKAKYDLQKKLREDGDENIAESDRQKIEFFRQKGSQYLLLFIISQCLEMIVAKPIPNRFRISFGDLTLADAIEAWQPLLDIFLAFSPKLTGFLSEGLKSNERAKAASDEFRQTLEAIKDFNEPAYKAFRSKVAIS